MVPRRRTGTRVGMLATTSFEHGCSSWQTRRPIVARDARQRARRALQRHLRLHLSRARGDKRLCAALYGCCSH